jgi:hypothetical protein
LGRSVKTLQVGDADIDGIVLAKNRHPLVPVLPTLSIFLKRPKPKGLNFATSRRVVVASQLIAVQGRQAPQVLRSREARSTSAINFARIARIRVSYNCACAILVAAVCCSSAGLYANAACTEADSLNIYIDAEGVRPDARVVPRLQLTQASQDRRIGCSGRSASAANFAGASDAS